MALATATSPCRVPGVTCESYGGGTALEDPMARLEILDAVVPTGTRSALIAVVMGNSGPLAGYQGEIRIDPAIVVDLNETAVCPEDLTGTYPALAACVPSSRMASSVLPNTGGTRSPSSPATGLPFSRSRSVSRPELLPASIRSPWSTQSSSMMHRPAASIQPWSAVLLRCLSTSRMIAIARLGSSTSASSRPRVRFRRGTLIGTPTVRTGRGASSCAGAGPEPPCGAPTL